MRRTVPRDRAATNPEGVVHAVAYTRCSSLKQAEKESSIPAQKAEIQRRAGQDGAVVISWWEDDGISAKNMEDRPGLNSMLDWISAHRGEVQRLYCYDGKRLARNKAEMFAIRKDLHTSRVQLICIAQPSTDDAAANAIIESVWDGVAEAERINLAKVVRRGQKQTLIDGWWPYNKSPYGFRRIGEANARGSMRWKLVPDPEQAEVIAHVFDLYLGGKGSKAIAGVLDSEGIPSPSRPDQKKGIITGWVAKHVRGIIDSVAVWGAVDWEGEVLREDHHPAVITKALWEEAQRVSSARHRTPSALASLNTSKSEHGLFRPWIKCGTCGGPMNLNRGGSPTERIWYYGCVSHMRSKQTCPGISVRADVLDDALMDTIEKDILTEERVRSMIEEALARMTADAGGEVRERRALLEARIKELSGRLARITNAVADGSLAMEDVSALSSPLRREREDAREQFALLPEPKPVPTIEEVNPEKFRERITAAWRSTEITARRKALDRLIVEVRLEPGLARVLYSWKTELDTYTYGGPLGGPEGVW